MDIDEPLNKYHKELTIKEKTMIIKQSVKIMELIKAIEIN